MAPSDRFKPIQKVASQRERKAAAALGESLKQRQAAQQRLAELKQYLAEYLARFERAARGGLSSSQVLEYQVFIGKLETAIEQQEKVVARSEQHCDSSKEQWRGKYSKSKAMDNAVDRMRLREAKESERREQAESDERSQRKR
ncbi:MAG: flagellar export protein FliJ [Gammaproteobacteria bacterium]|nr:flagellar export protein FliJ [Gammaproteobacteria bacterium]MCB1923360.1 flagellar export protein FliJ [Gammaproteobacteria bacterium]